MTILKNKLNVVLDIGKTNVKLLFLRNKKLSKNIKLSKQLNIIEILLEH